ncbi:MAG: efflux transporter outer membrane subunit [Bacteroides sp.]|nr:efflux transporter outer membrane subunit [Bacteroides sp.]
MTTFRYNFALPTIAAAMMIATAGCSAVKQCREPQLNLPEKIVASESDSMSLADIEWFEFYSDPMLKEILTATLENNRDFMGAAARVDQLRELYGAAKTDLLPQISATVYGNQETNNYHDESHTTDPEYGIKATLSWEADLWGNLRWNKRRQQATYLAGVEDMRAMQMTLIAEAASAYYRLVALDNEIAIVKRTLSTRSEELEKAKLRYQGGLTSEIVYLQAQVEYNTALSLIPGLERQIEVTESALNLLMGRYPGNKIERTRAILEPLAERNIPVGLPSELLTRRPDLRGSEMKLRQAMAAVGVAYTDRFPRLTFTLTGGLEDNDIEHILKSPFTFVGGALVGPIVDFGKRKKKYRAALAAYDEARLAYEQDVLTAFKEVNDAATAYRKNRQATEAKSKLHAAAERYMELAHLQYRGGSINYLDVLDAQRRFLDAEIGLTNAIRDEMLSLVTLYKSLGGGWNRLHLQESGH